MAGLTDQGLAIATMPEILESFSTELKARYGQSFSTDTNTPEGIFSGILADRISDVWLGVQGTYDGSFPKTAVGINLVNCAERVGITPIGEQKSYGLADFSGLVGSIVPVNTVVTVTGTNARFATSSALTLSANSFTSATFSINSVVPSTNYSLIINDGAVTITSSMSPTAETIIAQLGAQITSSVAGITVSYPTSSTLKVDVVDVLSEYSLVVGNRIVVDTITNSIAVEAEEDGTVYAPTNTLNTLLVPLIGITSVTNRADINVGRLKENDNELRARRYASVNIIGAGTNGAMTANIRNIEGVIGAFVIENKELSIDGEGRPPKSFEVVVEGGDEEVLAQKIWEYHPAGIEIYGLITRVIKDKYGVDRVVKFSRPNNVYVHVQVFYKKTLEETFPTSGELAIKQIVSDFGNSLNVGQDVFPQRFFSPIFRDIQGISELEIRMAYSSDGLTPSTYTTSPIILAQKDVAVFDPTRITVQEV